MTENKTNKELMSVEDFMEIYGITKSMFYSKVRKEVKITSLGRRTFIKRIDADAWLAKQESQISP